MMRGPEDQARYVIDSLLAMAGWTIQDRGELNLGVSRGVAVREFPLQGGLEADYLLFVDRKAVGVVEAKAEGMTLSGVADQTGVYATALRKDIPHVALPLPFLYESTGTETFFRNARDPEPRSRRVFAFHKPETLAEMATEAETLRARLRRMPPLATEKLWKAQIEAITNLEASLAQDKPRALIQMATGSGKTFTMVNAVYRLIKFARAKRVLFLVDRNNLGRQAYQEFGRFATPDDGRKFTELYNVQRLETNAFDPANQVVITTIQRLYSMLSGEPEYEAENEERSLYEVGNLLDKEPPKTVRYNPAIPIESFDFIITDECHRSIYNLWQQVLEYFDAHLVGLTATPSKQTFGFFNENLVMEYDRARAVADGVNVAGEVYRIRTHITEQGSRVESGYWVEKRDRRTRRSRWEELDDDLVYTPNQLDGDVVSESQIRTVVREFRDRLYTDLFPGRTEVPKTLVFAKDDTHAENIVRTMREEFGRGNEFCQKITYKVSGKKPEELISDFRISYYPRIAVTVDMIATGTDVKPIEALLFMRMVRSRSYFEQMLGRGTRVISPTDMEAVNPNVQVKDRFVLVDAVGVVESEKIETGTLEKQRDTPFEKLVEAVGMGVRDEAALSSLAGRLARLGTKLTEQDEKDIRAASGGLNPNEMANLLLDALDADKAFERAQKQSGSETPTAEEVQSAAAELMAEATRPFDQPELRATLVTIHQRHEQTIDRISVDAVTGSGYVEEDTERIRQMVSSFRAFIEEHKDDIAALQLIFNRQYRQQRVTLEQMKELADTLRQQPPHTWTTEGLWKAYARLERDRVRGANGQRVTADLVSLVRHAVQLEDELVPYPERVQARYQEWLEAQQAAGKQFTPEQRWWLDRMAEYIGVNLSIGVGDFIYGEFFKKGGTVGVFMKFGKELPNLMEDLNQTLNG